MSSQTATRDKNAADTASFAATVKCRIDVGHLESRAKSKYCRPYHYSGGKYHIEMVHRMYSKGKSDLDAFSTKTPSQI